MISKGKIKYVRSLGLKKKRDSEGVFVGEGPKVVADLMKCFPVKLVVATAEWAREHRRECDGTELIVADEEELQKVSFLQHPQQVLGVFEKKASGHPALSAVPSGLSLALDGVQDPGNLGTIVRIADWFGIDTVYCSQDTADAYNPKVVQATMGSIARVRIEYVDLEEFLGTLPPDFPVYGTLLDGQNIYEESLDSEGIIVMGNEGNGISAPIRKVINRRLLIPNYQHSGAEGTATPTATRAESLNVAIATAITCAEFRRRQINNA